MVAHAGVSPLAAGPVAVVDAVEEGAAFGVELAGRVAVDAEQTACGDAIASRNVFRAELDAR